MNLEYNKILNKLRNKKVIVYGAGKFFSNLDFDFSQLNIIGIADKKFKNSLGQVFHGFPVIPYDYLNHLDADFILIALEKPKEAYMELKQFIPPKKLISFVKIPSTNYFIKFLNKFKNKNNIFVLIKKDGKRVFNPKIKNLTVKMYGKNNYIEIHEPFVVTKKVLISCYSNSKIVIETCNRYKEAEILVGSENELYIGRNTTAGKVSILLRNSKNTKMTIGYDCMLSYNVIIRTEDAHTIYDCSTKQILNPPQDVNIGNHVWVAANTTILKGSYIPSNCIVGTYSLVNKKFTEESCIIAGIPAKVVKQGINWDRQGFRSSIKNFI